MNERCVGGHAPLVVLSVLLATAPGCQAGAPSAPLASAPSVLAAPPSATPSLVEKVDSAPAPRVGEKGALSCAPEKLGCAEVLSAKEVLESGPLEYGAGGREAEEALQRLDAVLEAQPGFPPARREKARALLALGRGEEASEILLDLVVTYRDDAEIQGALGVAYLSRGQIRESLGPLRRAAELEPNEAERLVVLGTAQMLLGDLSGAESRFRGAISRDGNSARAHGDLGALLIIQGKAKQGVEHLKRADLLNPGQATFASNLAYGELLLDRIESAKKYATRAITLDPALPSAWLNFGLVYLASGDRKSAREAFERAAALDPTDPRPQNNLRDLDELDTTQDASRY